jgi:hypothetical protein
MSNSKVSASNKQVSAVGDEAKIASAYAQMVRHALASGRTPDEAHADGLLVVYGLGINAGVDATSAPAPRPGFFARLFGSRS